MKDYLRIPTLLLLLGLLGCKTPEIPPNIVLIMADDMGYECLGANGSTEYKTPNLDRLAADGIRFENCYSQPLCTPSRVKIMTGKYNFRNYEDFGYLNPNQKTFGNLLQNAGYATCVAGKWQLNGLNRDNPNNQDVNRPHHFGFDEYCLWQLHHNRTKDSERYADALITQNGEDLPRHSGLYGPRVFADYVMNFIERKVDQPFFVYYPMVLVHDPFVPTPDSPQWAEPERRYENDTAYFADMMAYTDKIIGEIVAKLKEKGIWKNTLFIFTADNGTHRSVLSSTENGMVKGAKGETINHGNHVPFILSWPKKMKEKRVEESIISFADVLPTLCDAAGVAPDKFGSDGNSFLPLITNDLSEIQDNVFIHYAPRWGNFGKYHNRWVMNGEYKLYQDGRFYNTKEDVLEKYPLSDLTEKEQKFKKEFQQILDENESDIEFELNNEEFKVKY
ncbi:sulfatase-like hydrolase/transferase [Prolixibacteraceae bacterium Z1-6]|uniref:Sulfatase-like hydrolase/transferase n=1 Tax=Draconibacterium aestuarii TaxID=2998507 RepID=A0A9X3J6Y1_9BACT|nr:sulfatase-like hydrolase/transferase [Prolixibacteraceae bacterium Z1-6]